MIHDPSNRRRFLASIGGLGLGTVPFALGQDAGPPPGVDVDALVGALTAADLSFTATEREMMLREVRSNLVTIAAVRDARLENGEAPAERFDPWLPGTTYPTRGVVHHRATIASRLPSDEESIAFASIGDLSHWIRTRQLSSVELTTLYLGRLERFGPKLECVVTRTDELAMAQARRADAELARGGWRGPLHGIPWGAKDLFDTAGVATTWGAAPYQDRLPDRDATVVRRIEAAGGVLVAKLTLGALAYGDVWFGGRTRNPFKLDQGSSGSSAGSAAATAAGLVGFAIGTETWGSIGSPSARCGATGLRPTFGRVSRSGAMALCWSLDKVGPIARSAADCAYVLAAIDGSDPLDPTTRGIPLELDMMRPGPFRVGYFAKEYASRIANDADRATLTALESIGATLVPLDPPAEDYASIISFLIAVEGAAAFDELTRSNRDDLMVRQDDRAWPNLFRAARIIPAVDYVQASRVRGRGMRVARDLFAGVDCVGGDAEGLDAIIAPQRHGVMHALTNMTGHPAITIRQPFRDDGTPRATTLWGALYRDGRLLALADRLEAELGLRQRRPDLRGL